LEYAIIKSKEEIRYEKQRNEEKQIKFKKKGLIKFVFLL